jgi:hypothetical protein
LIPFQFSFSLDMPLPLALIELLVNTLITHLIEANFSRLASLGIGFPRYSWRFQLLRRSRLACLGSFLSPEQLLSRWHQLCKLFATAIVLYTKEGLV